MASSAYQAVAFVQDYSLTLIVFIAALTPIYLCYKIPIRPRFSSLRGLPCAPQKPLLQRLFIEPNSLDFVQWAETVPNDGMIRYFGLLNGERVLLTTTDGTRVVHSGDTKTYSRPPAAKAILCRLTGGGIFAAEGSEHASQRKEMQPGFKHRQLKDMYPTFWKKTVELLDSLDSFCGKSAKLIEVDDWVSRGTLDAIALAGFGFDFNSIEEPQSELVRNYRTAFLPSGSAALIKILAQIVPIRILFNLPMKRNRDAKACIQTIRCATREVIKKRESESTAEKEAHKDILSVLLASPKFATTEDMVSQCMAVLAAGHEASALALGWTLYELSKDPERQQRLREEIRTNMPSPGSDTPIDPAKVDSMEYLEAVVKESLRFWGPVPRQTRVSPEKTVVCGQAIPARTPLVVSLYLMNRSKENWGPTAGEFIPERWLGSAEAKAYGGSKDRYCFSTFSHGARSCIGQKFAHYEILIFLAGLVGKFEWSPGPEKTVEADHWTTVMLKTNGILRLTAKPLDLW